MLHSFVAGKILVSSTGLTLSIPLEAAFVAVVSPEIFQTLLNLAEFMEHDGVESGLPIDISILAELALERRAYAKALHYKEREHSLGGGGSCVGFLEATRN